MGIPSFIIVSPSRPWTTSLSSVGPLVNFECVAQTQSSHLVNIQARVSGFLDKRVYNEGEVVKEGQVLFQIRVS